MLRHLCIMFCARPVRCGSPHSQPVAFRVRTLWRRLRIMMKMHGLSDVAYYTVQYAWFIVLYMLFICVLIGIGSAVGIHFFRLNSYGLQFVRPLAMLMIHGIASPFIVPDEDRVQNNALWNAAAEVLKHALARYSVVVSAATRPVTPLSGALYYVVPKPRPICNDGFIVLFAAVLLRLGKLPCQRRFPAVYPVQQREDRRRRRHAALDSLHDVIVHFAAILRQMYCNTSTWLHSPALNPVSCPGQRTCTWWALACWATSCWSSSFREGTAGAPWPLRPATTVGLSHPTADQAFLSGIIRPMTVCG